MKINNQKKIMANIRIYDRLIINTSHKDYDQYQAVQLYAIIDSLPRRIIKIMNIRTYDFA